MPEHLVADVSLPIRRRTEMRGTIKGLSEHIGCLPGNPASTADVEEQTCD
jgi:hypothetical protein